MVFTERTGLENLYSIVKYCIDKKSCKRRLIADHFKDHLWSKTGNCHKMCDVCQLADKDSDETLTELNCISEASIVFKILEKNLGKDKRLTANKLADLVSTEISKSKELPNKLNKEHSEQLIIELLLKKYLREEFSYTPYSTICYLVKEDRNQPKDSFNMHVMRSTGIKPVKSSHIKIQKASNKPTVYSTQKEEIITDFVSSSSTLSKRKSYNETVILDSSDDSVDDDIKSTNKKKRKC